MFTANIAIPRKHLRLWLAADAAVIQKNGQITRWNDLSGNGLDALQECVTCCPEYLPDAVNGKPAVHFDGEDDYLSFSPLEVKGLTQMTLVLVSANWKLTTNTQWGDEGGPHGTVNAALLFEETGEFGSWGVVYLNPFQTIVKTRFGTGQPDSDDFWQRPESIRGGFSITVGMKQGDADYLFINGERVAKFVGKRTMIANTGNTGWLGRGRVDTYGPFDIAEVLIYGKALADAELKQLHVYLMTKYFSDNVKTGE